MGQIIKGVKTIERVRMHKGEQIHRDSLIISMATLVTQLSKRIVSQVIDKVAKHIPSLISSTLRLRAKFVVLSTVRCHSRSKLWQLKRLPSTLGSKALQWKPPHLKSIIAKKAQKCKISSRWTIAKFWCLPIQRIRLSNSTLNNSQMLAIEWIYLFVIKFETRTRLLTLSIYISMQFVWSILFTWGMKII